MLILFTLRLKSVQFEVVGHNYVHVRFECPLRAKVIFDMYLGQRQLWKLENTTLNNKAGLWRSPYEWNFIGNDDGKFYIETTSDDNKILGLKGDEVVLETKVPNKAGQLWIKGEEMPGGYTPLKNYKSSKVLTATASGLKAKGNYININ